MPATSLSATLRHRAQLLVGPNVLLPLTCLLGITIFISIWLIYFDRVEKERTVALLAAKKNSENIVTIVAANLDEILRRASLYARIAANSDKGNPSSMLVLNPQKIGDSAYVRAAIFDKDGALEYSSANRSQEPELQPLLAQALGQLEVAPGMLIGHPPVAEDAS